MNNKNKAEGFIRRIYRDDNKIIIEDSNNDITMEEYSEEKYAQLKRKMSDSLENFDINSLKDEIFEGKLRRFILMLMSIFGLAVFHFNIIFLLVMLGLTIIHEVFLKSFIQCEKDYNNSKYFLKYEQLFNNRINDNAQIKEYVDTVNQKLNTSSINCWQIEELKALREKILEEAGLYQYDCKPKVFQKKKK